MYYFQELPAKQVWIEQELSVKKKRFLELFMKLHISFFLSTTIVKKSFHYWDHPENIGSSRPSTDSEEPHTRCTMSCRSYPTRYSFPVIIIY